jgi:predicted component of type VI protein secretion system
MALTTQQEATYDGRRRWTWAVWLEGPAAELDAIRSVTWLLHPTFPNPERTTTDRASKFRIKSAGWGEFTLRAVVERKDGKRSELSHDLTLNVLDSEEHAPMRGAIQLGPARVFLSHSASDERVASVLQEALRGHGIEVLDPDEMLPGDSFESAIHDKVREADAVVALMSPAGARAVQQDVESARRQKTPVLIIDVGENPIRLNPDLQTISLASAQDVPDVIDEIVQAIQTSRLL